jgi:hypothetical protein
MAEIVELKPGERPPGRIRHALVIASRDYPPSGTTCVDVGASRTYFADDRERDIALMLKRASVWADARQIPIVYLRRDGC